MMKNKLKKSFFAATFAALAGTLAFTGCDDKKAPVQEQKGPAEVAATVETLKFEETKIVRELPGRVDAVRLADVSARVTGVLLERKFEEGKKVEKGQVLFQIDPAPLQASRDAAAAQVSADMDEKTVEELAKTALPAWHNFKFEVQRLRAEYLLRRMDGEVSK